LGGLLVDRIERGEVEILFTTAEGHYLKRKPAPEWMMRGTPSSNQDRYHS
jgi:hypothetical protein